jgi:toxin-antitoxin system PIN domain toxin
LSYTLDANILLYAANGASPLHKRSLEIVTRAGEGPEIVYLFWPTIMAYLRIATHPAIFPRPLSPAEAIGDIELLMGRSHIQILGEQDRFWTRFCGVAADTRPKGNFVADAHLAALMLENGVRTIWTHDRDFRMFPNIEVIDPFE